MYNTLTLKIFKLCIRHSYSLLNTWQNSVLASECAQMSMTINTLTACPTQQWTENNCFRWLAYLCVCRHKHKGGEISLTLGHSDREGTESDSEQTAHFSSLDPSRTTAATNTVSILYLPDTRGGDRNNTFYKNGFVFQIPQSVCLKVI